MNEILDNLQIVRIEKLAQVQKHWGLFQEGLSKLNTIVRSAPVPELTYFRVIIDIIDRGDQGGVVFLVKRQGEGKFLGYCIALNNSSNYHPPSLLVYAAYSNGENRHTVTFGLQWLKTWAKERGYVELQAFSPRINGSAFYLFEKKWKFQRRSVLFTQTL